MEAGQGAMHKTIMGFLYSVSRTSEGEYWPLYLGLNTIGRATNSSVRLSEATISDNHAEIVIRQMKNPDSVLVSIQDARSTCGTLLNGSSLGFDAQECHNGDILTIGEHYELYLIIVDAKSLGLAKRDDFMQDGMSQPMQAPMSAPGMMGGGMPYGGMPYGGSPVEQPRGPQPNRSNSSTVIMPAMKK
ncbi:MAG: FHA domain-containing protein [Alistipes sp.]|nr:FHA domain-containing protein [Alistipes sp.]